MLPITNAQIKKIHALKKALNIDDDLYKELLLEFDALSSRDLSYQDAAIFISSLEEKAVDIGVWKTYALKYSDLEDRENMASPAQLRMIEAMWREICYFDNDDFAKSSLRKFLRGKFNVDDVMFLTKINANKVINAIKSIKKNLKRLAKEASADGT